VGCDASKRRRRSQIMTFIYDVVIMGRRLQDVEEIFTHLVIQTNKMGSEINGKKRQHLW